MKLSDTQLVILSAAAQRDDRIALPLPSKLKGGAAAKVVDSMIAKGLIEEVEARRTGIDDGDPVWRETGDGHATTLIVTDAGFAAIGIGPDEPIEPEAPQPGTVGDTGATADGASEDGSNAGAAPTRQAGATGPKIREGTKQAQLVAMLRDPGGATIDEIAAATSWRSHTIRGAMSGALKKKLGLTIRSDKVEGRGRIYRIV